MLKSSGKEFLKSTRDAIEEFQEKFVAFLLEYNWHKEAIFAVRLTVEEALANAMKHGNEDDPEKKIEISWSLDGMNLDIVVVDEGDGYEPEAVPDPTRKENLTLTSGRGLALMRAFVSHIKVIPPGNRVELRFDGAASSNQEEH